MDTPILITAWRRVEKLERLLLAIKKNKPKKFIFLVMVQEKKHNSEILIKEVKATLIN